MFRGNEKLRSCGEKVDFTPDMIQEYIRCKNDVIYFCMKYFHIISLDKGDILFDPHEYQKRALKCIDHNPENLLHTILMFPRQAGKCVTSDTKIKARNKKTKQVEEITIGNFYGKFKIHVIKDVLREKFIDSVDIDEYEVLSETGWEDIKSIHKTIEYEVFEIKTKDFILKCADNHIIINDNDQEIFVQHLKKNNIVKTIKGNQRVNRIRKLKYSENMYDLELSGNNHTYYTNGILSHNTTVVSAYLLHYALFNDFKTIAIVANKQDTALEIMGRIRYAFENLPIWLQQGVKEFNKGSMDLENGSKIISSCTTSTAVSGKSISILYIDEMSKIPKNVAEQFVSSTFPVISSGKTTKIIISSTPFGLGLFADFWKGAVNKKNDFYPMKIRWQDVPGRDDNWRRKEIRKFGEKKFRQEYSCVDYNTKITVKNKETGEIKDVCIGDLYV